MDKLAERLMAESRTPGVAVALVSSTGVQSLRTYGVTDMFTGHAVGPLTSFDAASNGKPLTALLALALVQQKKLDLDRPLSAYLAKPYLDSSPWSRQVTLRQALSHSSGLPNRVWEHVTRPDFQPGSKFSYSGNGYLYVQAVIEGVTHEPFEQAFTKRLAAPLGLVDTHFVDTSHNQPIARGHISLDKPLLPLLVLLAEYAFPLSIAAAFVIARIWRGSWRPPLALVFGLASFGSLATLYPFVGLFGLSALKLWLPLLLLTLGLVALCLGIGAAVVRGGTLRIAGLVAAIPLLFVIGFVAIGGASRVLIPLPLISHQQALASSSMRTNITDFARIAQQLLSPSAPLAPEVKMMRQPQIWANDRIGWGLGMGVEREAGGALTYWQWGDNPGSQSLIVIDPSKKQAVAILTNGARGLDVARPLARLLLQENGTWALPAPSRH